ncbi:MULTISPECIES: hypothetical protein [unclassified Rhizobium]|uniref:hypothetical protein n=1 Tax=unclassified Rhizobium TaxID=2613769 RepID=UPI0009E70E34|nr:MULTISPECIES: hypothetical protein [unclassified Rhizobium]
MLRIVSLFLIAGALCACSAMTQPLPKCDGYSRRPLNRSMWQPQDNRMLKRRAPAVAPAEPARHAASYAEQPASVTPAAFAHFDAKGHATRCEAN